MTRQTIVPVMSDKRARHTQFTRNLLGTRIASAPRRSVRGNYIDFISSYCDRWCERCAFTDRCSAFAVQVATAMCDGDFSAGLELAVGTPPPMSEEDRLRRDGFLEEIENLAPTHEEAAEWEREIEEQEERLDELPMTTTAETTWLLAQGWLADNCEALERDGMPPIAEALQIASWDCFFIPVKLHRALHGRDSFERGESPDEDPIQNDWNGTAKVALISIVRSIKAWDTLADATRDPDARQIADALHRLQREVEHGFPDAWNFVRPGFDAVPPDVNELA